MKGLVLKFTLRHTILGLLAACTLSACTKSKEPVTEEEEPTATDSNRNQVGQKPGNPGIGNPSSPDQKGTDSTINSGRGNLDPRTPFKPAPAGYGLSQVQSWVGAHRAANPQGVFRYVYISPQVATNRESSNKLRVAIAKAWNHLSWQGEIDIPTEISDHTGLVYALNLQKVWNGEGVQNWGYIAGCISKRNIFISPAPKGDCRSFPEAEPVAAERFVYNAVNGGPYANIHKTPNNYGMFLRKYALGPIFATTTQRDAIVCGPRITAFRLAFTNTASNQVPQYSTVQDAVALLQSGKALLYAYSSDEFDGRDNGTIRYQTAPTDGDQRFTGSLRAGPNDDGTAIASEWWMQLPNGMMYYSIHGEGAQERGKAEFPFAIDPANWKQNSVLATGRSCITCHIHGNQSAPTDPEFIGKNGWSSGDELNTLYGHSAGRFAAAMKTMTLAMSDDEGPLNDKLISGTVEPIKHALMLVEGPYTGGGNYLCNGFCNGKFGAERRNMCETMPAR
jgi:hypothetical protein